MNERIMCTYCFYKFARREILYRCMARNCQGKQKDKIYAKYREIAETLMGKVLSQPIKGKESRSWFQALLPFTAPPETVRCDVCQSISHTQLCPICHEPLARGSLDLRQPIISVVGSVNAGKSCYIATLLHTLIEHGAMYGLSGRFISDQGEQLWHTKYEIPLFEHYTLPPPTPPSRLDASSKTPLIYRITVMATNTTYNFNFFDAAGEDMRSEEIMEDCVQQLFHSDGVIFLLDPFQIKTVQALLKTRGKRAFPATNSKTLPMKVLRRYINLYEDRYNSAKVATPVAFTLSKLDSLYSLFPANSLLPPKVPLTASLADPQRSAREEQAVSSEVAQYLQRWNREVYGFIEDHFITYRFFGISALGYPPKTDDNTLIGIFPSRVEQPFLWILQHLSK